MAWFDQLMYNIAPLFGPVGKGIADNMQDSRTMDAVRGYQGANDLTQFASAKTPDNIYSPEHLVALDKFKNERLDLLRKNDATEKMNALDAGYRDIAGTSNLRFFADPDSRAEMVKAGLQIPDTTANPELQKGLTEFTGRARNEELLTDAFAQGQTGKIQPDTMASIASNPSLVKTFDDAARGSKTIYDMAQPDYKALERTDKVADTADTGGFASAIAGLIDRAQSPGEKRRLASTGGYDPQGESDILAAFADYPRAGATALNSALDNYRGTMEKTPTGAPYTKNLRAGDATSTQMLQDFVIGGPKAVGAGVTNHPRAAATGPTPKEIETQRRAALKQITDLKLKRGLVAVDKDFPEEGTAKRQAYDDMIAELQGNYDAEYGAAKPAPKAALTDPFKGDASRAIPIDKKGKPQILAEKKLNGKTYYKVGPGAGDWVDKRP
jgi:hypothetical protein